MRHGTEYTYNNGCRCTRCRKAASAVRRARLIKNKQRLAAGEVTVEHGKIGTYTYWGCRCEPCRKSMSDYQRDHAAKRQGVTRLPQPVTISRPAVGGRLRRFRSLFRAA